LGAGGNKDLSNCGIIYGVCYRGASKQKTKMKKEEEKEKNSGAVR
jgi:hypothetical protein